MPATKALPQFEAFGGYVDPFAASNTVLKLYLQSWRASMDTAFLWTERWMQTVSAFAPAANDAPLAPRPIAAIIDLAQAAAARNAAELSEIAAAALEITETAADTSLSIAQDAVAVVEHVITVTEQTVEEVFPPDDLTRLVGIGPKLSIALAECGVTRFAHLAAWTEADLAEVDKALDLKGRAVRDAWIAQAKRFSSEA